VPAARCRHDPAHADLATGPWLHALPWEAAEAATGRGDVMSAACVHVFGIRHHGPGSARSLLTALEQLRPDCVLVEGPPDADGVIALAAHAQMQPPVALLVYASDDPRRSVFYPLAAFSPEWNALRWALGRQVPVRFIDLPQRHRLEPAPAVEKAGDEANGEEAPEAPGAAPGRAPRPDPLRLLAQAAGIADPERFWEILVEQRRDGAEVFPAILEAMRAARQELGEIPDMLEQRREAWMRTAIRAAQAQGRERIAVVCGAWHAPVLAGELESSRAADAGLLAQLPVVTTQATWVPWSQERLGYASGYGAGIESPGWYEHLWSTPQQVSERWLVRVARLLRKHGLDCSSAHIIEAVRLAGCLASLRGHAQARLADLDEAVRSIFCFGADGPLGIIHRELVVGIRLGVVPPETPAVPLQLDLDALCRRLRLPRETLSQAVEFDLRQELDRERSRLLHRLLLVEVPWGTPTALSGKGTFKEGWVLEWKPDFVVALIAAGGLGATVADAAAASAAAQAARIDTLPSLTTLFDAVLLSELPQVAQVVLQRLQAISAVAADVTALLQAIPALARTARYGDVRGTDTGAVVQVLTGIVERAALGLSAACASLDDEAAAAMRDQVVAVADSLLTLARPDLLEPWQRALRVVAARDGVHGLVAGRAVRLLHDQQLIDTTETARAFAHALSTGGDPAAAAAWLEGFLAGSGLTLLHDDHLFGLVDQWLASLSGEAFLAVLPLVRRTCATFSGPERRQLGERVAGAAGAGTAPAMHAVDAVRADACLPLVAAILGLQEHP